LGERGEWGCLALSASRCVEQGSCKGRDGSGDGLDGDGAFDCGAKCVSPELLQAPVADGPGCGAGSPRGKMPGAVHTSRRGGLRQGAWRTGSNGRARGLWRGVDRA